MVGNQEFIHKNKKSQRRGSHQGGLTVLSISLFSFFDEIGENIFIDYGFM